MIRAGGRRRVALGGFLGALLVGTPTLAESGRGRLERALSGEGVEVVRILDHRFEDLDRDGIKEILVQGEGRLVGSAPAGTHVMAFRASQDPGDGAMLAPAAASEGGFAGVFRFDRASFRWHPLLIGCFPLSEARLLRFRSVDIGEVVLVQATLRAGSSVVDRVFHLSGAELIQVLGQERGDRAGEGLWIRPGKVLAARGIPDPFRGPRRQPGMIYRVRYRWDGHGLVAEHWSLVGRGFRGDLHLPTVPVWDSTEVVRVEAARRAWDLQRAADRGAGTHRLRLEDLCTREFGEGSFRIPFQRDGFAVAISTATGSPEPRLFLQPFRRTRDSGGAVWIALEELRQASES